MNIILLVITLSLCNDFNAAHINNFLADLTMACPDMAITCDSFEFDPANLVRFFKVTTDLEPHEVSRVAHDILNAGTPRARKMRTAIRKVYTQNYVG